MATLTISHPNHGYEIKTHPLPAYIDGTTGYATLAKSDSPETLCAVFITQIINDSSYVIQDEGILNMSHGFTTGRYLYLSDHTAGGVQHHAGFVDQPVLYTVDQSNFKLINTRPYYHSSFKVIEETTDTNSTTSC